MSTIANIMKRNPGSIIAILLGIVACFTVIYINRDSIFSGPLAAGPVAAGPVAAGPSAAGPSAAGPSEDGPMVDGPVMLPFL